MKFKKLLGASAAFALASAMIAGCGRASSSGSTVTLGGSLSTAANSLINSLKLNQFERSVNSFNEVSLFALSDYTVKCVTISSPVQQYSSAVSADGSFSIDVPPGTPLRCGVFSGTTLVANFLFSKTGQKDLKGNTKTINTLALSAGSSGITFSFNQSAGSATADSSVLSLDESVVTTFDPTGSYTIASLGADLPTGYTDVCAAGTSNCNGPQAGQSIYLKRVSGKSFTPDAQCVADRTAADTAHTTLASCNGTTGTDDRYGLLVWSSSQAFQSCGSKLGFPLTDAKAYAGIDFSGDTSVSGGGFTYTSSISISGTTHAITEGWKSDQAKASWPINNCYAVTVGSSSAYRCNDPGNSGSGIPASYQIQAGGGCVDASNQPFRPANDDWSTVNWSGISCTNTTLSSGDFSGYKQSVCHPTVGSGASLQTLTCTNTWKTFKASDNSAGNDSWFDWNRTQVVAQNTLCSSSAFNGYELQRLQCYSNYYYSTLQNSTQNAAYCFKDLRANWAATTAAEFLDNHGPDRARLEYAVALVDYLPGNAMAMFQTQTDYRGVHLNTGSGDSWVNCKVRSDNVITFTKIAGSNDLMIAFVTETRLLSSDNNACSSNSSQLGIGTSRSMFKMVKQ